MLDPEFDRIALSLIAVRVEARVLSRIGECRHGRAVNGPVKARVGKLDVGHIGEPLQAFDKYW